MSRHDSDGPDLPSALCMLEMEVVPLLPSLRGPQCVRCMSTEPKKVNGLGWVLMTVSYS